MGILGGIVRSLLNSLIVSTIFGIASISLYLGEFPPSLSKIQATIAQFQKVRSAGKAALEQSLAAAESAAVNSKKTAAQKQAEFDKNNDILRANSYQDYVEKLDAIGADDHGAHAARMQRNEPGAQQPPERDIASEQALKAKIAAQQFVQDASPSRGEIPPEWQNKFYQLQSEILRLNQRVLELERTQRR